MLKWVSNYYAGCSIQKPEELKSKINSGAFLPGVYLLTLPRNPDNILEIIPALSLMQRPVYDLCPVVIGVASGKEEAMDLACGIIGEVYEKTGSFHMEEYVKNR